jgi:hypothetical protein
MTDMQHWQKEHPLYALSVRNPKPNRKLLYEGEDFVVRWSKYYIKTYARWDDELRNGSNTFHVHTDVYHANSDDKSECVFLSDVPEQVARIPQHVRALQKWGGCLPMGPWFYIESTLYLAGNRDCNGLLEGEVRQLRNGKTGLPVWQLMALDDKGEDVPLHTLKSINPEGDTCPTTEYKLVWRPWNRIGVGKERQLNAAREVAIWPDATDEQLMSDDLRQLLIDRHPALIQEFHGVIVGLGFTW